MSCDQGFRVSTHKPQGQDNLDCIDLLTLNDRMYPKQLHCGSGTIGETAYQYPSLWLWTNKKALRNSIIIIQGYISTLHVNYAACVSSTDLGSNTI
jgi:hypothetical protein